MKRAVVVCAFALLVAGMPARAQERQGPSQQPQKLIKDPLQPTHLPALPPGMTLDFIREGDQLFHGRGGCFACHGTEGEGLPAAGDQITVALNYVPYEWAPIDSLIRAGLPDPLTRSPIAMPRRGARGDLSDAEIARVAAYVWAISQTQGEPWPGGHADHHGMVPPGSTSGTATSRPWNAIHAGSGVPYKPEKKR